MSYIPDCRTDANYNEKFLTGQNREVVRGYDWCAEQVVKNAFDNLDCWDARDVDVRPSDIEKAVEAFKPFLLDWIESSRNELITAMLDEQAAERFDQKTEYAEETPVGFDKKSSEI